MRYVYNLILYLILPLLPLRLLWKSRKNISYRKRIAERFSYFNFSPLKNSVWIHAVSVGEAVSTIPLIQALLNSYPRTTIVVTTMTPTGAERIQKTFAEQKQVMQLYVPYDYPLFIKRFLEQINPKILVIMETELWPNILHYCSKHNIPILLANARLSEKSFSGYKKILFFLQPLLNHITMIATQSKNDAKKFTNLGVDPKKITTTGNIKFDIQTPKNTISQAKQLRLFWGKDRPIWIAASTHKGEEEKILAATKIIQQTIPESLLILVPRHPERFDEVFNLCCEQKFNTIRFSDQQNFSPTTNIILGDVMGQLLLLYAVSDITFVGGSLVPWGGHNLLEPAALAKPILSGKNLDNFLEISQFLTDANALIKVDDEITLAQNIIKLFQDSALRNNLGTAALDVVEKHRGATKKILEYIKSILL